MVGNIVYVVIGVLVALIVVIKIIIQFQGEVDTANITDSFASGMADLAYWLIGGLVFIGLLLYAVKTFIGGGGGAGGKGRRSRRK